MARTGMALAALALWALALAGESPSARHAALIVDGQNNHKIWPTTSGYLKSYLEETGLFSVEIATAPPAGGDMEAFRPPFARYSLVVSNYNGDSWSAATKADFDEFVSGGGGFVSVHAANNAFPEWQAYNEMIGLGGWGGRTERDGPYIRLRDGEFVRDHSPGVGGRHGVRHEFPIDIRDAEHPITRGLPKRWLHAEDELYDRLRGPARNLRVLATAFSTPESRGTGEHEPILMAIRYGEGRVFHTTLGHGLVSQRCNGFIATFQRGAEWAVTGEVTQSVPESFPGPDAVTVRPALK